MKQTTLYPLRQAGRWLLQSAGVLPLTLDAMGKRTREEVKDTNGQIALATTRAINQLNRVASVAGATGQTKTLVYDANGDLLIQTDPVPHHQMTML